MDINNVKKISKEMATFCRQAVKQTQNQPDRTSPQILAIVIVALAASFTPERTSFWDAQQN